MNKLLNDLVPKVLADNNYPRKKNEIVNLLNNGNWTSIPVNGNIIKLVKFYQKLKWFNMNKACVPRVTWEVDDKPNLCESSTKIVLTLGISNPLSTIVVHSKISASPALKASMEFSNAPSSI